MKSSFHVFLLQILTLVAFSACDDEADVKTLSVDPVQVNFGSNSGSKNITISTNAESWAITQQDAEWLDISELSGTGGSTTVTLTVATKTLEARTATLTVSAGNAKPVEVVIAQSASDFLHDLQSDLSSLTFPINGGAKTLTITTDAAGWNLSSDADWLAFNVQSGGSGNTTLEVSASPNPDQERSAVLTLTAPDSPTVTVEVTQEGSLYPNYNTSPLDPDPTGMTSNAVELAAKIKIGWNIGNTMEAIGSETAWGNPKISPALIDLVKQNGFNAVRIPCSWNQYMALSSKAELKTEWLNRVKEVVQFCVEKEMYVVLNIHWDGGWLENNCTPEKQVENNAKQKAFWQQIATHLRDFDEHLLFASANEPNVDNATQMEVLHSYHQTFVDAVRSTGGRNAYRVLVVQGPSTDIEKTNNLMTSLPVDNIADRLMVEVHYYTPWNFCGLEQDADWGKMFYYWGDGFHSATDTERNATWGEEPVVLSNFQLMKTKFVDQGVPVIMGEYGAMRRTTLTGDALTNHLASRAYYLKYVTAQARAHGIIPFYWDNGGTGNHASGIFRRDNNTVSDQLALDALIEGANE